MNKQQIIDVLKGLTVAGGLLPLALVQFDIISDPGKAEKFAAGVGTLISIAGLIWLAIGRSDPNMVKNAAEVKGVQVHVNTETAPPAVVELASPDKANDVYPMEGGPRVPPKGEDAHEGPRPDSPPTYRNEG